MLGTTTVRKLVRQHGGRIGSLEQGEAQYLLSTGTRGQRLRGVPLERPRQRAGWLPEMSAAVEAALRAGQERPPDGVTRANWQRVLTARAEEAGASTEARRRLGPQPAPGHPLSIVADTSA